MPCTPGRKRRRECCLLIGEAGIGVPHDQPLYMCVCVCDSDTDNPSLVDRKNAFILHKYFEIISSYHFLSVVPK
jgi:hypothetical protein